MGSPSSHPESSSSRSHSSLKRNLSHFFCGGFRSKSNLQEMEDDPLSYKKSLAPVDVQNSTLESSSVFTSEAGDTASMCENGDSSERSGMIEEAFLDSGPSTVQTSRDLKTQPVQESVSGNATECIATITNAPDAISEDAASVYPGHDQSPDQAHGLTVSHTQSSDVVQYSHDGALGYSSSALRSLSIVSDSLPQFQSPGDDGAHVTTTSSSGFLVSDSDQDLRNGDLLRLDLVSISSSSLSASIAEINSHETRRNSMRLFWDALARRSLIRNIDSPIIVFATGLADDLGSHGRWLLDFSGDLHYYGYGHDLDSFSVGRHRRHERRRLLRSEVSEAVSGIDSGYQQSSLCASGLHVDGTCSCDSFLTAEESSSLASISRIILLAEALFEVLDEIDHQSLSLSLSSLSLPAPESIVDAFPLKCYKKNKNVESDSTDVRQCYICLADYEEGDNLRVLPCNHEFHIPCIDKWLKEVNRVCPVCRRDICEGNGECSVSNPQV